MSEAVTQTHAREFFDYLEHIGDARTNIPLDELEKHVLQDVVIESNGQPICLNSKGFMEYALENRKRFTKVSYRPSFEDAIYTYNSASIAFDVYCTTVDGKTVEYRAMAQIFFEGSKIKRWVEVVETVTEKYDA